MNLLRVLLRSVCGSHPSDVPPKSKISVQIEQNGNGRRSGAFLHISFKNSSICKAFGVRQRPPQGAEFVCVPCGANNSKSSGSDTVWVRPPLPAPVIMQKAHPARPDPWIVAVGVGFLRMCRITVPRSDTGRGDRPYRADACGQRQREPRRYATRTAAPGLPPGAGASR